VIGAPGLQAHGMHMTAQGGRGRVQRSQQHGASTRGTGPRSGGA
jgi:hypothetical protein